MIAALAQHWPEYLIEMSLLGIFMVSACCAVAALNHPRSAVTRRIPNPHVRRTMIGILMGITAIALIYSPWGQRSGAHMNPGTTLTFLLLGKVKPWDAVFYVTAQFAGGIIGVGAASLALRSILRHPSVNHAVTLPGLRGFTVAWIAEFAIALMLMTMVLFTSNHVSTMAFTGIFVGILVSIYIAIEAPLSGMSMNPARTLGSALHAQNFRGLWIYFSAPPLGMLAAAAVYVAVVGANGVHCCKMYHGADACIFNCGFGKMPSKVERRISENGIQLGEPSAK